MWVAGEDAWSGSGFKQRKIQRDYGQWCQDFAYNSKGQLFHVSVFVCLFLKNIQLVIKEGYSGDLMTYKEAEGAAVLAEEKHEGGA